MEQPKKLPWNIIDDEIVISGIGGRYPESDSLDEFRDNLYNNVDMITSDDRRWPTDLYGMTNRMGKLKEIDKFDASFFGIIPKVADEVDPQGRILLETTWESIIDAGYNPQQLRGSNTGVYVGYTSVAMPDGVPQQVQDDIQASKVESLLWFQGGSKAFYANRVSFLFDFHGPSMSIDIACASSMVCLDIAVTDLRLGKCDQAIVAGVSINLQPFTNHIYKVNNIAAPDGRSKVWDQSANGYVRGETVCSLFLQKKSDSKRIYATILHAKTNIDGYKLTGMFFPSAESQLDLMVQTYTEANVDPLKVNYFESHGTGTKAGDPQEAKAILEAYCRNRKDKLPIGLLKSNIGHGEGASGVASISKLCIVYENKCIPANLNLKKIKTDIASMVPPLDPVCENRSYEPGIAGINSFGIGGVNAHALVKPNQKDFDSNSFDIFGANNLPRIINLIGRQEESIEYLFRFIENNPQRITREFLALLNEIVNYEPTIYSAGFPYRGTIMIKKSLTEDNSFEYQKKISKIENVRRPICFFFSGMGSQWSGMAKAMMNIELFAATIDKCAKILKPFQIDLHDILLSEDPKALDDKVYHFVAISSVQIALIDLFTAMNVKPDIIIGHSFGEIACAYADGCLTLEQSIMISYWRGKAVKDSNIINGMMAAVGLTWPETVKRCPKGVFAACHNSEDSVTISGSYAEVDDFIKQLTAEKIFAKEVQCANIPFHSPFLQPAVEPMLNILKNIIPKPMNRSEKWISTSVAENEWSQEKAQKASPEYFVNNLMNPVLLHEATKFIPDNAIIIELASHTLFQAIFKRSMPKCDYVGLMKRGNNKGNLDFYLQSLGQLYQYGCNVQIQALYPKVEWPVPRNTQSIGSLMRWDHSNTFLVKKYPEYHSQATASDFVSKFSLSNPDDQFLKDHSFDNKCFLPATSYLLMAWRRLAVTYGQPWFAFPVEFENVQFKRLISLTDDEIRLKVRLLDPTGEFIILDGNNIAASGTIRRSSNDLIDFHYQHLIDNFSNQSSDSSLYGHKLNTSEFYTEMNVRGYDYGPKFKQIKQIEFIDFNKSIATVKWTNNLITFVESMIQLSVSHTDKRLIYVSSSLPSFKCDPRLLFKNINDDNDQQQQQQPLIDDDRSIIIDSNLNFIASRGIEIQGLKFVSISQKNVMNDVKLEKYEFVPFEESKAIETIDYEQLRQYTNDCDLIMETILAINKKQTIESNDFINLRKILSKKSTLSDHHVLLQILIDVFNELVDENDNLTGKFMDKSMIQTIIDDNQYDLSNDLLEIQHKNHRLNRSSLDIINENSLRNLSVIEVNYNQQITIDDLLCHMNGYFHYPLVVDSIIMTKNDLNNDSKISSTHKLINWPNVFESKLPAIDAPVDLFIYRDSIDLIESINFDLFGKDIALNVKENGFVYGIFRLNYTKSEQTLMNLMEKSTNINDSTQADRIKQFESSMIANGFNLITKKSDSLSTVCMLFRKQIQQLLPEKQCSVPVYFGAFNEWVDQLKQSFTAYKNRPKNENIWMVSDDNNFNGILGMTNCLRQEPGGDRFRCIFSDRKLPQPIDFNRSPYNEIMRKDLSMNVYKNGKWGTYRLLDLEHDYNQIRCEDYYLDILKKADMTTMKWIVNDISNRSESIRNDRKLVNVQIHFSGIDGKDLLIANGNNNNDDERSLGTEFSGYRTDTKEPVMGLTYQRSIATSINVDERFLLPVPNNWELDDAAASIYSFFIAWYSLIEQAKLQPNETILINPGCSPNGLAALQIAQQMKCKIIITANSDEKRKYLMENCDINDCDCHVLNSMDSNFTDQLMIRTSFKGVDLVFNSLSMNNNNNDHMRNLSKIINDYGRFVDVDHNSNPKFQSSNVNYFNISPTLMSLNTFENIMPKLLKNFRLWFDQFGKQLKPLPRMIFDRNSYQQAFTTLNRDENIGKILIQIRNDNGSQRIMAKPRTSFVANKCYILVGGLGGLGLEIAYWLAKRGARKLVLVSRSGIKNEYQYVFVKRIENILKNQENEKIQIKISTSDPTTMKGAEQLLLESQELGPIGGLFHFATVLSDAFIEDQTPESFAKVCAPKMVALGNLDRLTRKLCPDIDYFVAFSSQSSARGFLGQNNYGYANSVMERICEKRCEDGLAGQAIAYGPIGDVGLWAQNEHVDLTSIGMVINTQRLTSCMEVLDRLLPLKQYPIVTSIVRIENQQQSGNNTNVKDHIWQGIGIDMDSLPDNLSLGDVGMESILAVEMQQRIEREYEVVLTSDEIKKLTVGMIKEYRKSDKESIKKSLTEFHNNNK